MTISLTDISLSFEPIPDDESFEDIDCEGDDYDTDSEWMDGVTTILKKVCPNYEPWTICVDCFEEDKNVCIKITTRTDWVQGKYENKIKKFLKEKFPECKVNVDSTEYDHSEDDEDTLELFDSYKEYKDKEKAGYVSVDLEDDEIKEWYKNNS
jgi:hypothetical protein